jgi:hypothetical protein
LAQKRDEPVVYIGPGMGVRWGRFEGWFIGMGSNLNSNQTFEEAPGKGAKLFYGDGGPEFRAGRWELWQLS